MAVLVMMLPHSYCTGVQSKSESSVANEVAFLWRLGHSAARCQLVWFRRGAYAATSCPQTTWDAAPVGSGKVHWFRGEVPHLPLESNEETSHGQLSRPPDLLDRPGARLRQPCGVAVRRAAVGRRGWRALHRTRRPAAGPGFGQRCPGP